MFRKRSVIKMTPSRAQGVFLARFEAAYFADKKHTLDTLSLGEPPVEGRKPDGHLPGVPRGTYRDWRSQKTSPTIRDLERLCALTGERQTLLIDPSSSQDTGDEDMTWHDWASELVARLADMEPTSRGAVLGKFEEAIEKFGAREGARNPSVPSAARGGPASRRS